MIVGYTTGVFDLFHQGHLNLLKNAKNQCDKLIVGVTTDELSLSFKSKLPIVPYEERRNIVDAIKYVDLTVPQEDMNKYEAWKKYRFHVLFASKKPTTKWASVKAEFLSNFNDREAPKIVCLSYTGGISSTLRRSKIGK